MPSKNKKVLVTGAEGFIGSHLTERLVRDGWDVRALVLYNFKSSRGWLEALPEEIRSSIEVVFGDVRDPNGIQRAMRGVTAVAHLAALVSIPHSYEAPDAYAQTNILGTLNVLQAARDLNISRMVHTSSSEVYGSARFVPMTEDHPLQGQSPYSASKIGADQMALSFYASFDVPVTILRPFNTYGPRQSARAVIPAIITQVAQEGQEIELGLTSPKRDFSFVEDTVDAFVKALEIPGIEGQIINVGSHFEISIGDVTACISEVMGRSVRVRKDERRLRPDKSEVRRLLCDNSKAKELLDWEPQYGGREGFLRGIKKTVEWFLDVEHNKHYRPEELHV